MITKYRDSLHLRGRVKSFLCDSISKNKLWLFRMFQRGLEPDKDPKFREGKSFVFKERFRDFVFSKEEVKQLVRKLNEETKKGLFIEAEVIDKAFFKYRRIEALSTTEFQEIKQEDASIERITEYVQEIDRLENIDLDRERRVAKDKLALLRLSKSYLDGKLNDQLEGRKKAFRRKAEGQSDPKEF
mmetsp:Transcript_11785/g.18076  ORF Transcript_11785/g.18076 Transcript_11785/m.18076 type:complete len:186 (-) Transcript_11785:715-1272(-)